VTNIFATTSPGDSGRGPERSAADQPPLCVDLDGTIIRSDLLLETLFASLPVDPGLVLHLPLLLARGRAALKSVLASRVRLDPALYPYNEAVVSFLREQRGQGRRIVLATASHRLLAEPIAQHLGLFDAVFATEGDTNLKGVRKAEQLVGRFGEGGFDYIGNSAADKPVWQHARHALSVGRARTNSGHSPDFPAEVPKLRDLLGAMRIHQWLKNLLVFVVLIASHTFTEPRPWINAGLAFLAFGLCASSVYLINDLIDLQIDRIHPRKRERPFASGRLPLAFGVGLAPLLLFVAAIIALFLPPLFALTLGTYYVATCAYSVWLKRLVLVDVFALASLYTLRLISGAAAVVIMPSFWLLAFSMFLFLSLAIVKRYAELVEIRGREGQAAPGRGYDVADLEVLASLGPCSAFAAVLVLALYINSEAVVQLYRLPQAMWLLCPLLLYWLARLWIGARRGKLDDDPIIFAVRDRVSRLVIALSGLVFFIAVFGI